MSEAAFVPEPNNETRPHLRLVEAAPRNALGFLRWAWAPLALFFVQHLLMLVTFAVASRVVGGWTFPGDTAGWDGTWLRDVGLNGYSYSPDSDHGNNVAFFPLFPIITRAFMDVIDKNWEITAIWVNIAAGAVFTLLFYRFAQKLLGNEKAFGATAFMLFFPGSVVLAMAYSEPIGFALSVACLLALMNRRWWIAGITAAFATSARFHAIALCFACAVAAFSAIRTRREWIALVAPLLSPLGLLAYFAYLWKLTGIPLLYFHEQADSWSQGVPPGGASIAILITVWQKHLEDWNMLTRALFLGVIVFGIYALVRFRKQLPWSLMVYTIVSLVLTLSSPYGPLPRLVAAAFPMLIAMVWLMRPTVLLPVTAGCAMVSTMLVFVMSQSILITP